METRSGDRVRQEQAAIVEHDTARNLDAVAHLRQRLEHGIVPEQQLQQQRDVPDGLDVTGRGLRHQPVRRQSGDADNETENGSKDDAETRDQQRIKQPDPEGAAVSRGLRAVGDQRLADIEAGGVEPEAEAGRDLGALQIGDGVAGGGVDKESDNRDKRDLIDDSADFGVVVEGNPHGG